MRITVILCTHNRSQSLAKALDSVAALEVPESVEWDVLVVDNNSSDDTRDVVEGFCSRYAGRFRYTFEPEQGKSRSLNLGVREARGDVLAFIDDDVLVEPTWLRDLTSHLGNGAWAGAGGRILPERSFSPPSWLSLKGRYALAPLALFDLGSKSGALAEPPFGANMAFQKRVFEQHGGFRIDLGPGLGRGRPQKSEDSEFGSRLLSAGERLRYEPSAVVYHAVPATRVQKNYFLAWWFDKARSDIRAFGTPSASNWAIAGVPLYMFRRLAVWTIRWVVAIDPPYRFDCKLKVWEKLGEIMECYRLSRD